MASANIQHLQSVQELSELKVATVCRDRSAWLFVDVFSTNCGPCRFMAPVFAKLAEQYGDRATFATLNLEEAEDAVELTKSCQITRVPAFLAIQETQVQKQVHGANRAKLEQMVSNAIQ